MDEYDPNVYWFWDRGFTWVLARDDASAAHCSDDEGTIWLRYLGHNIYNCIWVRWIEVMQ